MKLFVIIILIQISGICFSQTNIKINARIYDSETLKPLIYASIFNKTSKSGTISNIEGYFHLKKNHIGDTIEISYIGYTTKEIVLRKKKIDKILLIPKEKLLKEVVIIGDKSFLYQLVYDCRKNKAKEIKIAKTYLSVESYRNNEKIELIENYYNGYFKGYDIEDLKLKNGRIAYKNYQKKTFTSTQTSFAVLYNKIFEKNSPYPLNPLSLSKRKIKKYYELSIDSKYKNNKKEIIYVINYKPKIKKRKCFYGKIWINKNTNQVIKITLNIKNSIISPFIPLHFGLAKIDLVEMNISKSFVNMGNKMYVKSIDFKYTIRYNPTVPKGSPYLISTNAFLYAYNYKKTFILPRFTFHKNMYQDYLNVSAFPYNDKFWKNINEFTIDNFYEKTDSFVIDSVKYLDKKFTQRGMFGGGYFIVPYIFWSKDRISFREDFDLTKYQKLLPSDRYNFNVQIYMDINIFNDTLDILTQTIFDPNNSFYHFKQTKESTVFTNMYFDIMEIQREKFEEKVRLITKQKIDNNLKIKKIDTLYKRFESNNKKISTKFFKEVRRGYNKKQMEYWNTYIKKNLGIDNISIFELYKIAN